MSSHAPEPLSECSTCHEPLSRNGDCLACLLRGGLDDTIFEETTALPPPALAFGDFEVERREDGSLWELGRGTMGVTYRAVDRVLHRHVALKVVNVPAESNMPAVRERFLREARAAAALRHTNVAGIFQLGVAAEAGRCYCAMELVEGETLHARVRRVGPVDVETALDIAVQVARALTAAMSQGLVHRDLKPSNLMLTTPDAVSGELEVKVIDFGLVKMAATPAGALDLTQGGFVGTPAFASPEQFEDAEVDARSDLYSLGVTLWYALTGRVPFVGRTMEELRVVRRKKGLPLEQLTARNVPTPVIDLLRSMLAVDPRKRPVSARDFLVSLQICRRRLGFANDSTRSLASTASLATAAAPSGGRRYLGLVLALIALAAVAAAGFWWIRWRPTSTTVPATPAPAADLPGKSIAVLPFVNLSADQDNVFFTDGVQDEILTDLSRVADLKVISRTSVMQYRGEATRNLRDIATQLGVTHIVEGNVQRSGSRVRVTARLVDARSDTQQWGDHYDRPLDDVFSIQKEIAQTIADQLRARISPAEHAAMSHVPTTDVLAFQLYQQAEDLESREASPDAKDGLLQAVNLLEQAVARDPRFLTAYCLLGRVHLDLYWEDFDHTSARRDLAWAALEQAVRLRPDAGETHIALARYYYEGFHDYDRALSELALARPLLPNSAEAVRMLGFIHRRQGRTEDTLREFGRAIELDPRNFGTLQQAGFTFEGLRRYVEAAKYYNRALAIVPGDVFTREELALISYYERADLRPVHALNAAILASEPEAVAGSAYFRLYGALAERDAEAARAALATFPVEGFAESTNFFMPKDWFTGLTARTFGDAAGAQAAFTTARASVEKIVHEQPDYAEAWSGLSLIDAGLGRKEDALREGRRACELLPVSKDAFDGPAVAANLAVVYAWTGEKDLALQQVALVARMHGSTFSTGVNYGPLKCDPQWDSLRGDPRLDAIIASLAPKAPP